VVTIHQDVNLYATILTAGQVVDHAIAPGRGAWLQVVRGGITLKGQPLTAGDGTGITDVAGLTLVSTATEAEVLLFDLAV